MERYRSADGVVQNLAATLQPAVSLDLWGQISAAMLPTVEHGLTSVMQSLLRIATDAVHQLEAAQQQQLCLTSLAAISGLATSGFPGPVSTTMIYTDICVPLLAADSKLLVSRHSQIIQAFSQIVAAGGAWSSALLLLHEVAADLQCWAHPTGGQALDLCRLTHPQQCLLVKSLLLSGLQKPLEPATGAADQQELCTFLEGALQLLQPVVFSAVSGSMSGDASHMVALMLPALCQVAEKLGPLHTKEFGSMLWATCRQTLQDGTEGQAVALTAVVQNIAFLMPTTATSLRAAHLPADPGFWHVLRQLLVDDNAFTRKQGLFVLEHAVRGGVGAGEGRQAWQAVLHLLALLEDFALHLIKAAWEPLILQLHQAAARSAEQQATGSPANGAFQVDESWLDVVWRRALAHPSPAVQAYMLESLLLKLPPHAQARLTAPCVLEDVMPAFCRGVLNGDTRTQSAVAFMKVYAAKLEPSHGYSFILGLLRYETGRQAPRAAMPAVLQCTMAAAHAIASNGSTEAPSQWHEAVMAELKRLLSAAQECGSLVMSIQTEVVQLAALLCPPSTISLASFGALLAHLPLASLHPPPPPSPTPCSLAAAKGWLVSGGRMEPSYSDELMDMFTAYFASKVASDAVSAADDAVRLARLMLLLDGNLQKEHLDLMFGHLQEKLTWLTERPYLPDHMALRIVTLLKSLIEVSQGSQSSQVRAYTLDSITNVAMYLRDHALHSCQVFDHASQLTEDTAKPAQAVVAISAAAPSMLPDGLRRKLALADLAVDTALQALTLVASDTQTRHSSSASALDLFGDMIVKLMRHVLQPHKTGIATISGSSAEEVEVRMEELAIVASCCQAVARCGSGAQLPGLHQLPGEKLLLNLLQRRAESHDSIQSSALRSRSQRAIWQALHSHLMLLQSLDLLDLQPQTVSKLLVAACADAAAAASDVLLPLLGSLRVALAAVVASPAAAALAGRCLTAQSLSHRAGELNEDVGSSVGSETQLARSHVASLVCIVDTSAEACWLAVSEEEKLRPAQYQALLDTFAFEVLFCQDKPTGLRAALHGNGGPLRHLVQQALTAGQQSAQLLGLVALHLAGLLVQCPPVALLYLADIQKLLVCDVRDISLKGSQLHEQPALGQSSQRTKLQSLEPNLAQHVGVVQLSARVAMVCLMHQLTALLTEKHAAVGGCHGEVAQHRTAAEQLGQRLFQNLLKDQSLKAANYRVNSAVHRAKLRHWQALAVLSAYIPHSDTHRLLAQIWPFLQGKDVASVKQYTESIIVNLVLREPVMLMHKHVLPSLLTYHARQHEGVTSALLVGSQVIRHAPADAQAELWGPFVAAAWPWTMWHHHAIRTFAQLILHHLLEDFPEAQPEQARRPSPEASPSPSGPAPGPAPGSPWAACLAFFRTNPDMKRLESSLGPALRTYDPSQAITPAAVLHSGSHLAGGSEESVGVGVEGAPLTLLEGVTDFLIHQRATLRKEANALSHHGSEVAEANSGSSSLPSSDFQRKMMPGDFLSLPLEGFSGTENEAETKGSQEHHSRGLILVASLVDKIPNLAGLTRTCEVFRAAAMVVSDKRVTKDPAFASISVTADQWLPLIEVAEADLVQWMLQKRAEGFALIGVEQTAESVLLPDFAFPQNTVLLLGREREGIPMQILQLLDHAVEIPQLGLIRSLNVHVSGAITLYEYSNQHLAPIKQAPKSHPEPLSTLLV